MNNGFIKVDIFSPKVEVSNPQFNINEILKELENKTGDIALFPELAITSYSCMDLFFFDSLKEENDDALKLFLSKNTYKGLVFLGGIYKLDSSLFNVCFIIQKDKLLGIVPKYYLPNYNEFQEPRWFTSGSIISSYKMVNYLGFNVPFGNIIFKCNNSRYPLGVMAEICEDIWSPISPSNIASLNGANVFLNLSASNEYLTKEVKRVNMVSETSRKNRGAYIYTSSNASESSTGVVFGGSMIASINADILLQDDNLTLESKSNSVWIDLGYIDNLRKKDSPYKDSLKEFNREYKEVFFDLSFSDEKIKDNPYPFRLEDHDIYSLKRVLALGAYGLARRIKLINSKKIVLGLSGGLDSTMSLIFAVEACKILNLDKKEMILPVFLPYHNSSSRTKENQVKLAKAFGLNGLNIPIYDKVELMLESIDHKETDVTYENMQVRVRTTILMELANKYNGILLGTSDLSEIAMGYSTYNGDSMSMYNINSSLSKTMIQSLVDLYCETIDNKELIDVLKDINNTPISAELNVNQYTENEIGKYIYIDFILYNYIKKGMTKDRISLLMEGTFDLSHEETMEIINKFFKRFYSQQYKRNASPESLKISSVSLDPHLDYRLASEVKR